MANRSVIATVKSLLGESGSTNDTKIGHYQSMANTFVNGYLININGIDADTYSTTELINHENLLAVAYFYKFESGDQLTAAQAESNFITWFTRKFRSPQFFITSG